MLTPWQESYDQPRRHIKKQIDILECEIQWALESITMNKASGGDGIPVELFQILEDIIHLSGNED